MNPNVKLCYFPHFNKSTPRKVVGKQGDVQLLPANLLSPQVGYLPLTYTISVLDLQTIIAILAFTSESRLTASLLSRHSLIFRLSDRDLPEVICHLIFRLSDRYLHSSAKYYFFTPQQNEKKKSLSSSADII